MSSDFLTISLLSYDRLSDVDERIYISEISTLSATKFIHSNRSIEELEIIAHKEDGDYLGDEIISSFTNIGDFNSFFENNDYFIQGCKLVLEKGLKISSHDDGEISIQYNINSDDEKIVNAILKKNGLSIDLIKHIKKKPTRYIEVDKCGEIISEYHDFDAFLYAKG